MENDDIVREFIPELLPRKKPGLLQILFTGFFLSKEYGCMPFACLVFSSFIASLCLGVIVRFDLLGRPVYADLVGAWVLWPLFLFGVCALFRAAWHISPLRQPVILPTPEEVQKRMLDRMKVEINKAKSDISGENSSLRSASPRSRPSATGPKQFVDTSSIARARRRLMRQSDSVVW